MSRDCSCLYPNTRSRGKENCPVHNPEPEDIFISSLKRNPKTPRESTPNSESDSEPDMDDVITQLANLSTTVANNNKETGDRIVEVLKDKLKYTFKEPQNFKGQEDCDTNDFLAQFDRFCTSHEIEDDDKPNLFASFLRGDPLRYYDGLSAHIKGSIDRIRNSFLGEYAPESKKFFRGQILQTRKLKKDESESQYHRDIVTKQEN